MGFLLRFFAVIGFAALQIALGEGDAFQITVKGQTTSDGGALCLNLYGNLIRNTINIWTCDSKNPDNQMWYFDAGTFKIRSVSDETKCLDAGDMKQGTPLQIAACNINTQQFWGMDQNAGTIYLFGTTQTSQTMCMDVKDAQYKDGTGVQVWPCDGSPNQAWSVAKPAPPPVPFTIKLDDGDKSHNFCLDLYGGDTKNGNKIDIWTCSPGTKGQQWLFQGGQYKIQSMVDPSKCIDGHQLAERTQLQIWDCNGLPAQTFSYNPNSGAIFAGKSTKESSNNQCISLTDTKDGAPVQLFGCNGAGTMNWALSDATPHMEMEAPRNTSVIV